MSYEKLGLKCGLEIHQQLEGRKLFGPYPTIITQDNSYDFEIRRFIRAAQGEGGKIDVAAKQEQQRRKQFIYRGSHQSAGLIEIDEEPPIPFDEKAFKASLQFCKMVEAVVSPVVQVMRKTVADGSNTSGFQRTALVGRDGKLGNVRIANVCLEEDSCRILEENAESKTYHLDRLGIPLIEVGTEPDIRTPDQAKEVAAQLGMMLRSLPNVKRGLGTIRQDVNVSIRGGTRVEIKGAQDLKQIPLLIELEVKRQAELLKIREELRHHRLNPLEIVDLTVLLEGCSSKVIIDKTVMGIKLHDFTGLLGRELQPNYRVGSEFSGRAKILAGVKGIFHSDELPNYGITDREVKLLRKKLKCNLQDGFVLVAGSLERCRIALKAVHARALELWDGVPKEVRRASADGTTTYMRPMPGAARMYPETDIPLIYPYSVEIPELLSDKIIRFQKNYSLNEDMASFLVKSSFVDLFEEIVEMYPKIKNTFISDVLVAMPREISRKYKVDVSSLGEKQFKEVFKHLASGKIHKDIVLDVMIDMCKGKFNISKYESLSTEDIHAVIVAVVAANKEAPFGALMGQCMKKLGGKVSGEVLSAELKKIIEQGHN